MLIEWEAPGPYKVAFSTREGGVSDGPFASLNLGMLTKDEPDHVIENRRRLAAAAGADPERATMTWQQHGTRVVRAAPTGFLVAGRPFVRADGLWSDEPGQPMTLVTADCLPIAIARTGGEPALAVLHAGWRGLASGVVAEGCRTLGGDGLAAAIGPGIGPCCYEVAEEVAEQFRARFGGSVLAGRKLDLWTVAELALREAGCTEVQRTDLCTACDERRFFSHRRDQGLTGRQGIIGYVVER
jgi:YfiH family protein